MGEERLGGHTCWVDDGGASPRHSRIRRGGDARGDPSSASHLRKKPFYAATRLDTRFEPAAPDGSISLHLASGYSAVYRQSAPTVAFYRSAESAHPDEAHLSDHRLSPGMPYCRAWASWISVKCAAPPHTFLAPPG